MGRKELKDSNTILLALDGSKISNNTSVTTVQIAEMLRLEIIGLYVIDEELVTIDYADYAKELGVDGPSLSRADRAALFEKRGHDVLQWLNSSCEEHGVCMMTQMGMGGVWDVILSQARKANLLAIGRRGNGHPDDPNYLGSNFRHIAHRVRIPLLVGGDNVSEIKNLLLAYHGKERAQKALFWTEKLSGCSSGELKILVVQENDTSASNEAWLEDIRSHLLKCRINDSQLMIRRGDPSEQIVKVAMETESDLIILGGYRHKAPLEWLEGSTLDEVLRRTPLPVLIG